MWIHCETRAWHDKNIQDNESNSNRGIVSGFAGATRDFDVKSLTLISLLVISRA